MFMGLCRSRVRFELRVVGLHLSIADREVEALEEKGRILGARTVRQAQPVLFSDDGESRPVFPINEKMLQADAEDHGDLEQRRKRREELSPLDLRQHA